MGRLKKEKYLLEEKKCLNCNTTKPLPDFSVMRIRKRDKQRVLGQRSVCKECFAVISRARYYSYTMNEKRIRIKPLGFESLQKKGMGDFGWEGSDCGVYYPTDKEDIEKFFREPMESIPGFNKTQEASLKGQGTQISNSEQKLPSPS